MSVNVIHLISNPVWGGGERYALDLCKSLREHGNSVAVITRGKAAVDEPFKAAGFEPGHLPLGGIFDFVSPVLLAKVFNRINAPVTVHVHNFKDAATAIRAKNLCRTPSAVRIIATRHLVKAAKTGRSSQSLYNALDAIVFVSKTALDAFMSTSPQVDTAKLHVIPNAIVPFEARTEAKNEGELRLVFAGRLTPEKGIEKLMEAFACLPENAVLHIAGTGRGGYVQSLAKYGGHLGIDSRIVWHGHVADPHPLMASADIGVVPSQAIESFGLTVLEFMHCGVPVVTTSYGGPAEIITNGVDGLVADCTDSKELGRSLMTLAGDAALRRDMGDKAAQTARTRFAYSNFYSSITALYGPSDTH